MLNPENLTGDEKSVTQFLFEWYRVKNSLLKIGYPLQGPGNAPPSQLHED
jgi:hypothetical protein